MMTFITMLRIYGIASRNFILVSLCTQLSILPNDNVPMSVGHVDQDVRRTSERRH